MLESPANVLECWNAALGQPAECGKRRTSRQEFRNKKFRSELSQNFLDKLKDTGTLETPNLKETIHLLCFVATGISYYRSNMPELGRERENFGSTCE